MCMLVFKQGNVSYVAHFHIFGVFYIKIHVQTPTQTVRNLQSLCRHQSHRHAQTGANHNCEETAMFSDLKVETVVTDLRSSGR